jgi:hypothetical protein
MRGSWWLPSASTVNEADDEAKQQEDIVKRRIGTTVVRTELRLQKRGPAASAAAACPRTHSNTTIVASRSTSPRIGRHYRSPIPKRKGDSQAPH